MTFSLIRIGQILLSISRKWKFVFDLADGKWYVVWTDMNIHFHVQLYLAENTLLGLQHYHLRTLYSSFVSHFPAVFLLWTSAKQCVIFLTDWYAYIGKNNYFFWFWSKSLLYMKNYVKFKWILIENYIIIFINHLKHIRYHESLTVWRTVYLVH